MSQPSTQAPADNAEKVDHPLCTQSQPPSPSVSPPCSQVMPPSPPATQIVAPKNDDDDVEMKQQDEEVVPPPCKDDDDDVEMKDEEAPVSKKRSRSRSPAREASPSKCMRKGEDADVGTTRSVPTEVRKDEDANVATARDAAPMAAEPSASPDLI